MIFFLFSISEDAVPYFRKIQPEEFWLYRFPRTDVKECNNSGISLITKFHEEKYITINTHNRFPG
jgi:hypothetical protein